MNTERTQASRTPRTPKQRIETLRRIVAGPQPPGQAERAAAFLARQVQERPELRTPSAGQMCPYVGGFPV